MFVKNKMNPALLIIISDRLSLLELIKQLSKVDTTKDLDLTIKIICRGFINADVYLLIVSFVNEMRADGKTININLVEEEKNCSAITYASRIDFFKQLNIDYDEKNARHDVSRNLIPIMNIPKGVLDLPKEVNDIFKNDFNMSPIDIFQLTLIISEMFCNTSLHSKSKSGAYLYCQKYRGKLNHLEFILVDSGIGIQKSLQMNEIHKNISNAEAISKSIEFGITCGEGRGHGLYFASEFTRRNNGTMILVSGENRIVVKNQAVNNITNNPWNGVYLKILFKFDSPVSLNDLMKEKEYDVA